MKPTVYMMLGLPGSGKTTFSIKLEKERGLPRFSLDEEYSKLGGNLLSHKWDEEIALIANNNIKSQLSNLVKQNQSVILDFCPWKKDKRDLYRAFIESNGALCHIYYLDTTEEELNQRLTARNASGDNYHQVTPEMLRAFTVRFDPPTNEEYELVINHQK